MTDTNHPTHAEPPNTIGGGERARGKFEDEQQQQARTPFDTLVERGGEERILEQVEAHTAAYEDGVGKGSYPYRNFIGRLTGAVTVETDGMGRSLRRVWSLLEGEVQQGKWAGGQRIPYRLENLENRQGPVIILDREETADVAHDLLPDYAVIATPGDNLAIKEVDWDLLNGRLGDDIYIAMGDSAKGERQALELADYLVSHGHSIRSIYITWSPEGSPAGWDIARESGTWTQWEAERWIEEDSELVGSDGPSKIQGSDPEWLIAARMNSRFSIIRVDGDTKIMETLPSVSIGGLYHEFGDLPGVKKHYKYLPGVQIGRDGNGDPRFDHPAELWMQSRMADRYDGYVFDPDQRPHEAYYRAGRQTLRFHNKWQGYMRRAKQGPAAGNYLTFAQHVLDNACHGNEEHFIYLWSWMAKTVRDPKNGPKTIVALSSEQKGTGKGTMGDVIAEFFGPHFFKGSDKESITGKFNSHLEDKVACQLDEGIFGGDRGAGDTLKTLITEDWVKIEPKGIDSYVSFNSAGKSIIVTTNNRWALPTDISNRRHVVFEMSDRRAGDTEFWNRLRAELENGGYEALLYHFLYEWPITVDFQRDIPMTEALAEQKLRGLEPAQKWLVDMVRDGMVNMASYLPEGSSEGARKENEDWGKNSISLERGQVEDAVHEYMRRYNRGGGYPPGPEQIGKQLRALISVGNTKRGRAKANVWRFPPREEAKEQIEAVLGCTLDIEQADDEAEEVNPNEI